MKSPFHRFVKKIVQQTDGTQDEKADLYEELMIHLELSSEQFIKEGVSEQEAAHSAMESFGDEKVIGNQIQQAMFPYRKEMMLTLAFASILFSFSAFLSLLFIEGDTSTVWLLISVSVSACLLVFSLQPIPFLNRRRWINSMLVVHLFIYLYGLGVASGVDASISIILTILSVGILLLAIVLIYRTTIYDYQSSKQKLKKQAMILHVLNLTVGIFVIAATLFFLWAFLMFSSFSSEDLNPGMFLFLIPLLVWIVSYITQMRLLVKEKKRGAYIIAAIPPLMILVIAVLLFR